MMVLPRREGCMSGLAILGIFAISLRVQNNILLLLAVGLAVLFLLSFILSCKNVVGIKVELQHGQRLIASIEQQITFIIRATSPRHHLVLVMGADRHGFDLSEGSSRLKLRIKCDDRGWQSLPSLRIESDFPFGIARSWCRISPGRILVAPRPNYGQEHVFQDGCIPWSGDAQIADSIEDWRQGMSLSRIHWKRYAGTRRLTVKSAEDTTFVPLEIDYDVVRHFGHETALGIMSAAVLNAMHYHQAFVITLPDIRLSIDAGNGGEALDALAMA
ncbi:DUF58 domain-containing protein [Alphaproteobacteria bacterium LSUCC0684]